MSHHPITRIVTRRVGATLHHRHFKRIATRSCGASLRRQHFNGIARRSCGVSPCRQHFIGIARRSCGASPCHQRCNGVVRHRGGASHLRRCTIQRLLSGKATRTVTRRDRTCGRRARAKTSSRSGRLTRGPPSSPRRHQRWTTCRPSLPGSSRRPFTRTGHHDTTGETLASAIGLPRHCVSPLPPELFRLCGSRLLRGLRRLHALCRPRELRLTCGPRRRREWPLPAERRHPREQQACHSRGCLGSRRRRRMLPGPRRRAASGEVTATKRPFGLVVSSRHRGRADSRT